MVSPMKGNEEDHLAVSLKTIIDNEKDLETYKNTLALKSDFNLLDAFRFFDTTEKGFITRGQLEDGLNEFGIYPTRTELYLLMRKYDIDGDSLMKYSEFCDMITPKATEYAEILTKRIPTYLDNESLDLVFRYETKNTFANVLRKLIEEELDTEVIRQKLARRPLFNAFEAFKALDKCDKGSFGVGEFKELLMDHGLYATTKDVVSLVEKFDKNQDGKVTYSEFVEEMAPKSPVKVFWENKVNWYSIVLIEWRTK